MRVGLCEQDNNKLCKRDLKSFEQDIKLSEQIKLARDFPGSVPYRNKYERRSERFSKGFFTLFTTCS